MATMTPAAAGGVPYRVPPEPSRWPSLMLALLMHGGLVLFLWAGISWQNTAPVEVEAEVWDMKIQAAAPPPVLAPPVEPTPEAAPPAPPAVAEAPALPDPEIALAKAKLKAEKQKQLREQRLAEEKLEREQQELADQKARELAEKKKLDKAAADKKLADKKAAEKLAAAEQKKLDKLREAEMRRITGAAGTVGDAAKSTAPRVDSGYLASITSKIKSTTSYLGNTDMSGNPRAVFRIDELPTGEIISVKMVKSSGVPAFDDAVEKGIIKSSPLPKKKDGTVERSLEIGFSMKDMN
ncbi:MAG: cell envelope integrity protein TolA [Pseudomonadota bacterium]